MKINDKVRKLLGYLTILSLMIGSLGSCSHYSGTKSAEKAFSVAYGASTRQARERGKKPDRNKLLAVESMAVTYVIGYIFDKAGKKVEEYRSGDSSETGVAVTNTAYFPGHGFLMVMRTVADPNNEYSNVASVNDFLESNPGTAGGHLMQQILDADDSGLLSRKEIRSAAHQILKNSERREGVKMAHGDKISMLAICPVIRLSGVPAGGAPLYAVSYSGMYYPLIGGSRFKGESKGLARRLAKAKESLTLEVYGPNGSGYSTGVVKIPLVWSPPEDGKYAEWVTMKRMVDEVHGEENVERVEALLVVDADKRLEARKAFVAPATNLKPLLRADANLHEETEATGWLQKGLEKLESEVSD